MKDTNERGIETTYQLETIYPLGSFNADVFDCLIWR
jgi:hypothetical protein